MIRGKEGLMIMGAMFLLLVLSCASFAAESGDPIDSSPYLAMGAGARALAMGGASTAVADDATAVVWNIAGLTKVKSTSFASMYSAGDPALDKKHNFLAVAGTLKGAGSFGAGWINAGVSDVDGYDGSDKPTGTFNSSDNAFLFSYGNGFGPVKLGAGIKILSQKVNTESDEAQTGFGGLDIGALAEPVEAVSIGLSVRNLFGKLGGDIVPVQLKLGAAVRLLPENNLVLAVDLGKSFVSIKDTTVMQMGAEYCAAKMIAFRLGASPNEKIYSAGIGVKISDISIDYAFSINRSNLESDVHYVSICASF